MTSFCKAKTRKRVSILVLPVPSSRSQKPEVAAATPRKKTRTKKHKKERKKRRSSSSSSEDQGTEDRERRRSSRRDKNKHACCYDASTECTETSDNDYEMQIVEELHLARSNRQLHVKVEKSYGELTSMDVDPADESATIALTLGFPTLLVPWVVLQELDSLKSRKLSKASCGLHLHLPEEPGAASLEPVHAASVSCCLLNVEDNDDLVLQCCLQYKTLYPEGTIMLCTTKDLQSEAAVCQDGRLECQDATDVSGVLRHAMPRGGGVPSCATKAAGRQELPGLQLTSHVHDGLRHATPTGGGVCGQG
ncbi:transcriptional protein SWT1 isoform X4 [Ictalurus punctatus]|uniref:Transcriptional protein SWT1 isoform X4 n=1 Tax=Ictalurus punctatus TaxID=7998 RepID=A0A9F7RH25_ICTPU|nr:transcriptional protein SWT1 isoform X4 [Ictalurus punctatus]